MKAIEKRQLINIQRIVLEQMRAVFNDIDLQAVGKELNVPLGESVSKDLLTKIKTHAEINRIEGVLLGLKICKEMWAQGTISHENIYENEVIYKEELASLLAGKTKVIAKN